MKIFFIIYRTKVTPYIVKGFNNKFFYKTFKSKYKEPNEEEYQIFKAEKPNLTKKQYDDWKKEQKLKTEILYCYEVTRKDNNLNVQKS